jgi:hypothetical protein
MKTLTDLNRLPISLKTSLVQDVLPEYWGSEFPNMVSFLEAYYEFLDSDENFGDLINDLYTIRDIEANTLSQLDLMFKEIGLGVSHTQFTSPREVIRNFGRFFRSKGTEYSAESFFRAFFNEDIEIVHPKNNLFVIGKSQLGIDGLDVLQNGKLNQVLSVLVKSPVSIATWGNLYRKHVHPAGFYLGAEVLITTAFDLNASAPLVKLDSAAGEITISQAIAMALATPSNPELTLLQTMGQTAYVGDSSGDLVWTNMDGLLETDSSYTDRNADSSQTVINVRLDPTQQIRDLAASSITDVDISYTSIYDLMKSNFDYEPAVRS